MEIELLEIIIVGLISLLSLTTELRNEKNKLTRCGYFVLGLSIIIIIINFINYNNKIYESKVLKENELYAEIVISTNSKVKIDSIFSILPTKLNLRDVKIGYNSVQIDFEKEIIYSGKARNFESWNLYYKSVYVKFDELSLDGKTIDDLNGKTFEVRIPELDKINCDQSSVNTQFYLKIRNISYRGFINCGEFYHVQLEGIK